MHTFTCLTCGDTSESIDARKASSDAEWHNTNTGHDVQVSYDGGARFILTDDGWVQADRGT